MSSSMVVLTNSRRPRHAAPDDLPHLPVADVDGVGARAVPRLQGLRAARATRLDRRGPRGRACAPTASASGRSDPPRRDVDRRSPRAAGRRRGGPGEGRGRVPRCASGLRPHGDPRRAAPHRVPRASTPAATSTSTTPAAACTRSRSSRSTCELLRDGVYGNPHSVNPTSSASTALVERARAAVLRYFNARRSEYVCIFTPNATGALRLVGEAYPFGPRRPVPGDVRQPQLGQRHPRVRPGEGRADGVRAARGARPARRRRDARRATSTRARRRAPQPVRLSGAVQLLRRQASARVDRAGPRARLGRAARLRRVRADEPARPGDVAAGLRRHLLLQDVRLPDGPRRTARARSERSTASRRPWFAGGTVVAATVQSDTVAPHSGHAGFEDGTVDYLGIPAVEIGLRHLERIGIDTISRRVEALGTWLLEALGRLRHSDGAPATRIYGPATWDRRGATVALNFLHPDGRVVDERFVDLLAAAHNISRPDRVLLQPRRRGGRVRAVEGPDDGRRLRRRRDELRRLHRAPRACPPAARSGCRSGSRATSPTSTGSSRSRTSSATWPTCRPGLPPRAGC